jgi:WD40 repeat protein
MRPLWLFLAVVLVPAVMAAEPEPQLKLLTTLEGVYPRVHGNLAFSPDGKILATSDYQDAWLDRVGTVHPGHSLVKLWDVDKRKVIATLRGHSDAVTAVTFSRDGKTLISVGDGREVKVWDVASGKEKAPLKGNPQWVFLAFSPDGKTIASANDDEVVLRDPATGKVKVTFKGLDRSGFCVAFSPDGKLLATGGGKFSTVGRPGEGEVKLWDTATGRERTSLKGHVKLEVSLQQLSYLHRGEGVPKRVLLKVAALNGMEFQTEEDVDTELTKALEKILDKDQREKYLKAILREIGTTYYEGPEFVWSAAFSPDGKTLASASILGTILLWDVQTGKRTATLQRFNPRGREEDINQAYSVAFSPDGKVLAAGTGRGIRLWDVESGEDLVPLRRPWGTVWSVAFSPDGKTVASAGSKAVVDKKGPREGDPAIRLWEFIPSRKEGR